MWGESPQRHWNEQPWVWGSEVCATPLVAEMWAKESMLFNFHLFTPLLLFPWATLLSLLPSLIDFPLKINRKNRSGKSSTHLLSGWQKSLTFCSCSAFLSSRVCQMTSPLECWETLYMLLRQTEFGIYRQWVSHEGKHSYLLPDYPLAPIHLFKFDHSNTNVMLCY